MESQQQTQVLPQLPFELVCDSIGEGNRPAWLGARQLTIGASEASAVMGISPWCSQLELWAVKTGRIPAKDLADREAVFWGEVLEPAIIEGFGRRTGRAVVPFGILLRSTRYPVLSATPDALVTDDPEAAKRTLPLRRLLGQIRKALKEGQDTSLMLHKLGELSQGWWPLQVKNIGFNSAEHWTMGVPTYYRVQCAQEALVWGSDRCTGGALIAGQKLAWDDILLSGDNAHDSALLPTQIVNLTRRFWEQHVVMGIQPAPDGTDSAKAALAALYPKEHPELVLQLGLDHLELARERDELKERVKQDEARLKFLDNHFRAAMGNAARVIFPDGSGFTLNSVHKGAYQVEACDYRMLLRKKPKKEKGKG